MDCGMFHAPDQLRTIPCPPELARDEALREAYYAGYCDGRAATQGVPFDFDAICAAARLTFS